MKITKHAIVRGNQRGIPHNKIDIILKYGEPKKSLEMLQNTV